jgi:predicted O-methyltransferase YrrM
MSTRTFTLPDALYEYFVSVSLRESDLLRRLRRETAALERGHMQIAPEQGQFMALLARLMGARRCLEVGVFTGYSTLCVASALPADGRVVACDVNEEWTTIARRYWHEAGVVERIELHLAPAVETLDRLLAEGQAHRFDFAFIDADKPNYGNYYERALVLLRPGGLVAVDNTLWYGRVADPANHDAETEAVRAFNAALKDDARIELSLVPIGDGMTLALKR